METLKNVNIFVGFIQRKVILDRVNRLLLAMVLHTSVCIRRIAKDRAEEVAFHRVLNNKHLKKEDIMNALYNKTSSNVKGKHILAIQDTSELNYNSMKDKVSGMGTVGNGTDVGFFIHPMIAVDASDSSLIGLSAVEIINRFKSKSPNYKSLPIEEKESFKWLYCSLKSKDTLKEAAMITHISDRESDIYDLLYRVPDKKNHLLIRATQDRSLDNSETKLFEYVSKTPLQGSYNIEVSGIKGTRTKHIAILDVRFTKVEIKKSSKTVDKKAPKKVTMYAIELKENKKSVVKDEEPVYWLLLTTHTINTIEDAKRIADWYCQRWNVEQLFRTLKSQGLKIERSQVEDGEVKIKLALLAIETAIQVMQLTLGRDENNKQPAKLVFNEDEIECLKDLQKTLEGKTEKQKNHHKVGSLSWASWCIGRLGGWKGYKSESPAGPITMRRGLDQFKSIFRGWCIAKKLCID